MNRLIHFKKKHFSNVYTWMLAVILIGMMLSSASCPRPTPRTGSSFNGSAKWALNIAQPLINGFAPDAQVYSILGANIYKDGRLPPDTGDWSFVAWSPSRNQEFQVTVLYNGSTNSSTRSRTSAPGVTGLPIPAGWVNSTVIFNATAPHRNSGAQYANLVVFNFTNFPTAPGQAVWGINFNVGPNLLVRWDGTYLGPQ